MAGGDATDPGMADWQGGAEADREALLQLLHDYLHANAQFDAAKLEQIFSAHDDAEFFNMNGFTYQGREHWARLWQYYGTQMQSNFWTPYDIRGVIDTNTAVMWCHRRCRRAWVGGDQPVRDLHYDNAEFMSRSTMLFRREAGAWRVFHVHFSLGEEGARPGNI